jgi:hypothetical protein
MTSALPPAELSRTSTNQFKKGKLGVILADKPEVLGPNPYSDSMYASQFPLQKAMTRAPIKEVMPLKTIE